MKILHKTMTRAFERKTILKVCYVARYVNLVLVLKIKKLRGSKSHEPEMTNVTNCSTKSRDKEIRDPKKTRVVDTKKI